MRQIVGGDSRQVNVTAEVKATAQVNATAQLSETVAPPFSLCFSAARQTVYTPLRRSLHAGSLAPQRCASTPAGSLEYFQKEGKLLWLSK
jgi:hypothetical protein